MTKCKLFFKFFLILFSFFLSSCSFLSPVELQSHNKFVLNSLPPIKKISFKNKKILLLITKATNPIYDTSKMAYSNHPYQVSYFVKNEWATTPVQMIQPLLIDDLERTGFFYAVTLSPFLGRYDYLLSVEILALQQNFNVNTSTYELVLRAELRKANNTIIATKEFSVLEPVLKNTPEAGAIAANQAMATALNSLNNWLKKFSSL